MSTEYIEIDAKPSKLSEEQQDIYLQEVLGHYIAWTEDLDIRLHRKNGWIDITDAYWGKLPSDFPFINRVVDPRIRTALIEKNARLINAKLQGKLNPREGGDMIKAKIQNAILEYQWDCANEGGSMLEKISIMDTDGRLYASKFAEVHFRYIKKDGKVVTEGNECLPIDIRDSGIDPACSNIKDANWFQSRKYPTVETIETWREMKSFMNVDELLQRIREKSTKKDNKYSERILSNKGLTNRIGDDVAFPIAEIVTEYRKDKWITFSPEHKLLLRVIDNPYKHGKIPVIQLKYYPIQGDPLGESEIEPVLPLFKAIQAVLNGFLDNMMVHIKPPLKILENAAQIETIVLGPDARWLLSRPDAVTEFQGSGEALRYFETTYTALVSAFNTAMGEMSQGTSNIDPSSNEKTATEVKASVKQQNTRDQRNQNTLSEMLKDMMMMWVSNNKQFLFADESKKSFIMRIVGADKYAYFEKSGLSDEILPEESAMSIAQIIEQTGGNLSDQDINTMVQSGTVPKYPIIKNPQEKDINKIQMEPKMKISDQGDYAELTIVEDDLDGLYDYVPSVRSMSQDMDAALLQARQMLMTQTTSPVVQQLLAQDGWKLNIKELLVNTYEDMGAKEADRYFSKIEQQQQMQQQPNVMDPNSPLAQGVNDANMQKQNDAQTMDLAQQGLGG